MYDGFISYSHAADDLLAPRLQAGLQRFAKPWWKRRALRIFRDESSLSANPHLWSSITEALDNSEWFVLLLSPDAARSTWVNQEIEYWRQHRNPERILPVLTDGDLAWNGTDVSGDATPQELRGAYAEEPRWVDLRFAREEEQLDLKNPRFASAIADIASALWGVPKDELESEEVKQHRRTVRTAWTAGIALIGLAITAIRFGFRSSAQAAVARSRELAAAATAVQGEDPELAMMLALQSLHVAPYETASPASVIALRRSLFDNQLARRFSVGNSYRTARLSPDGTVIYHAAREEGLLSAIDVESGQVIWEYSASGDDQFENVDLRSDGELLSLTVRSPTASRADSTETARGRVVILNAINGNAEETVLKSACPTAEYESNVFSPDGRFLSIQNGTESCRDFANSNWVDVYDTSTWIKVAEIRVDGMYERAAAFSRDGTRVLVDGFGAPIRVLSFPHMDVIQVFEGTGHNSQGRATLSPTGDIAVLWALGRGDVELRPLLVNVTSGERIAFLDAVDDFPGFEGLNFSSDGSRIAVTTRSRDYVFDANSGRLLTALGEAGVTFSSSFSSDGSKLLTATPFDLLLWDLASGGQDVGQELDSAETKPVWINPNAARNGPHTALWTLVPDTPSATGTSALTILLDPKSGQVTHEMRGMSVQLPDGRFLISPTRPTEDGSDLILLPLSVWDPASGQVTQLTECETRDSLVDFESPIPCGKSDRFFSIQNTGQSPPFATSPDGSFFAAASYAEPGTPILVRSWDSATLTIRSEFEVPHSSRCGFLVGAGENWVAFRDCIRGHLQIYDVDSGAEVTTLDLDNAPFIGEPIAQFPDARLAFIYAGIAEVYAIDTSIWQVIAHWHAHKANLRGLSLSPDGHTLVTTGEDDFANVWDISGIRGLHDGQPPPLLDSIPAPKPSDAIWISSTHLGLLLADGARWYPVSLDVQDLTTEAKNRLTRSFSPVECATYGIDPCPTVDEMRER